MRDRQAFTYIMSSIAVALLSFGGTFFVITAGAYTNPVDNPPNGNTPEPLNVGTDGQTKQGDLGANTFFDANDVNFYINPTGISKLQGAPDPSDPTRIVSLNVHDSIIENVRDPQRDQDVATKAYVEALSGFVNEAHGAPYTEGPIWTAAFDNVSYSKNTEYFATVSPGGAPSYIDTINVYDVLTASAPTCSFSMEGVSMTAFDDTGNLYVMIASSISGSSVKKYTAAQITQAGCNTTPAWTAGLGITGFFTFTDSGLTYYRNQWNELKRVDQNGNVETATVTGISSAAFFPMPDDAVLVSTLGGPNMTKYDSDLNLVWNRGINIGGNTTDLTHVAQYGGNATMYIYNPGGWQQINMDGDSVGDMSGVAPISVGSSPNNYSADADAQNNLYIMDNFMASAPGTAAASNPGRKFEKYTSGGSLVWSRSEMGMNGDKIIQVLPDGGTISVAQHRGVFGVSQQYVSSVLYKRLP